VLALSGLGFYWAHVYLLFYSNTLLRGSITQSSLTFFSDIWLGATAAHFLTLILASVFAHRIIRLASHTLLIVLSAALTSGACYLLMLSFTALPQADTLARIFQVSGFILDGVFGALLLLMWGEVFGSVDGRSLVIGTLVSWLLTVLIFFFATNVLPSYSKIILIVLPAINGLFLIFARTTIVLKETSLQQQVLEHRFSPRILLPFAAMFVLGVCGELFRSLSLAQGNPQDLPFMGDMFILGGGVGIVLLAISFMLTSKFSKKSREFFFDMRLIIIVIAAAFLVAAVADTSYAVSYALFNCGVWMIRMIIWIYSCQIVRQTHFSPIVVFGLSQATFSFPILLGVPLGNLVTSAVANNSVDWTVVSLLVLFLLLIIAVFILNPEDVKRCWGLITTPAILEKTTSDTEDISYNLMKAYGLSEREAEIAAYLFKGRSLPFIKDKLFIAVGTVKTHVRHIYEKMGVHNRQEFLDAVERTRKTDSSSFG
jgi:DNA-binding CsgD family transcriptional regulator